MKHAKDRMRRSVEARNPRERSAPPPCLAAALVVAAFLLTPPSAGQGPPPDVGGQWAGPYVLNFEAGACAGEITHAIHIPPSTLGGVSGQYAGRVFFVTKRECGPPQGCDANEDPTSISLWDPAVPTAISATFKLPNDGTDDPWCGGHTITPTGDIVFWGGQDWTAAFGTGHSAIWRWRGNLGVFQKELPGMASLRWYATGLVRAGGDMIVTGHWNEPNPCPCPGVPFSPIFPPCPPCVHNSERHQIFQEAVPLVAFPEVDNVRANAACSPLPNPLVTTYGYPWLHQLMSGDVFHCGPSVSQAFHFLRTCSGQPRWIVETPTPAQPVREEGNSVILLTFDSAGLRREAVYNIGGGPFDPLNDHPGCGPGGDTNTVSRIVNPAPGVPWQAVATMAYSRKYANSLPLPDGTIWTGGGKHWDVNVSNCEPRLFPEIYDPVLDQWSTMNKHDHIRGYHHVAFLLRDGRVVIAGGVEDSFAWPCPSLASAHSVEIFSPPYLFKGPRPGFVSAPTSLGYGPPSFTLTAKPGADDDPLERVTLVRPSSVTHGVNFDQRFVELRVVSQGPNPLNPRYVDMVVERPETSAIAPPGWYLLFVVSQKGVPSVGEYVHIP